MFLASDESSYITGVALPDRRRVRRRVVVVRANRENRPRSLRVHDAPTAAEPRSIGVSASSGVHDAPPPPVAVSCGALCTPPPVPGRLPPVTSSGACSSTRSRLTSTSAGSRSAPSAGEHAERLLAPARVVEVRLDVPERACVSSSRPIGRWPSTSTGPHSTSFTTRFRISRRAPNAPPSPPERVQPAC